VTAKRILFVINSIGRGGAEPSLFSLIRFLDQQRGPAFELHVALLDGDVEERPMPKVVRKHVLFANGSMIKSVGRLSHLVGRVRPDLLVSYLIRANVATAIAGKAHRVPSILCERMHLSSHLAQNHGGLQLLAARALPRLTYRAATAVIGVSTGVTQDLIANYGVSRKRATTIFNSYDLAATRLEAESAPAIPLPERFLVAAGRLVRNKNFGQLIDAYAQVADLPPLVIMGEGEERPALERRIAGHKLQGRVLLPGHVHNPAPVFARADFYVASSLNEGFPNAMMEAMILGLPVVVSNCPSGPAEILAANANLEVLGALPAEYGILVEPGSVEALAAGIRLLQRPAMVERYRAQSQRRADDFSTDRIMPTTLQLFESLMR
jgi:glycosyltransferase involved in cell wall biosynthesis